MWTILFYLFTVTIISIPIWCTEQPNCGILNEYQLYNEDPIVALDEFPWLGQIYYRNIESKIYTMRCNSVLINMRYLLSVAHCFDSSYFIPEFIVLGDYSFGNNITEQDCDAFGTCAPIPKQYMIQDIVIHPSYNINRRTFDFAIIHVKKDVEFSAYIQPICLPPVSVHNNDFLAQYHHYAGFLNMGKNSQHIHKTHKTKSLAHIIPIEQCKKFINFEVASTYLCGSLVSDYIFLSGAALMGVNVINKKLSNFYLIGVVAFGGGHQNNQYAVFAKISSHFNWIQDNCNLSKNVTNL